MGTMSKKCSRIGGILTMAGVMLLLTGCSQTQEEIYQIPEDKKLVIYTSHKEDVYEPIIKEFEERTGIFVELKAGDTIALLMNYSKTSRGRLMLCLAVELKALKNAEIIFSHTRSVRRNGFRSNIAQRKMSTLLFCITDCFYL